VVSGFYAGLVQGWIPMPTLLKQETAPQPQVVAKAPETPRVPILVGLPGATADELLKGRGLRLAIKERRPDDLLDAESVISQDPAAESLLAPDSQVVVVVSSGKPSTIAVPELVGRTLADARQALEAAGLSVGTVEGPEDGVVKSSQPAPAEQLARGAVVALVLEQPGGEVPKLVGLPWRRARSQIEKAGFKLGKVSERSSEESDPGEVLEQTPEAGKKLAPGATIDLVHNEE
jgi:beta-lactam-binding protein with PASTA domain